MTKETFTATSYPLKLISAFNALGSILVLVTASEKLPLDEWSKYLLAILFIITAYICWKIPPSKIEIDESGIKRLNNSTGLMSQLLQPNTQCEWKWIHTVSTTRSDHGYFTTVLHISKGVPNPPKNLVAIHSNMFKDYESILKIIKDRAPQANLDETTTSILKDQIDMRPVRPIVGWLFIIVVLLAFVYLYISKG